MWDLFGFQIKAKPEANMLSGFYLFDVENNVLPKLEILRQFGFYSSIEEKAPPIAQISRNREPKSVQSM
jgi:hypothetical protein